MSLKAMENIKNIRFMLKAEQPSKLAKIVYETHIITETSQRGARRPPNVRENKFMGKRSNLSGASIRKLMALPLLTCIAHMFFIRLTSKLKNEMA